MELKLKRRIALICMLLAAALLMASMQSYGKSAKPQLEYEPEVYRDYAGAHFFVYVNHPVKGAIYSATVSDEKIARLVDGGIYPSDAECHFSFYALKDGKVTVTVKQKLNKKTKKIGTATFTIESEKLSAKEAKKEKLFQKVVKKGTDCGWNGVSPEVLQVTNIKNSKDKVTARVKLRHKVTADELKVGKNFSILATSKNGYVELSGKLKKGSRYVTVSAKKTKNTKAALKKGKSYYITGLNTKRNAPYRTKITL